MSKMTRHLLTVTAIVVLPFVSTEAQVPADQIGRGGQWLSWSQKERITYVFGFIDGYYIGTSNLCEGADLLFKVRDPHRVPPHPDSQAQASILCFDSMGSYSKGLSGAGLDLSPYADIVTEFYTKHPEYSAVPFPELMLYLGDGKCDNADLLYQKALKGELHRVS